MTLWMRNVCPRWSKKGPIFIRFLGFQSSVWKMTHRCKRTQQQVLIHLTWCLFLFSQRDHETHLCFNTNVLMCWAKAIIFFLLMMYESAWSGCLVRPGLQWTPSRLIHLQPQHHRHIWKVLKALDCFFFYIFVTDKMD